MKEDENHHTRLESIFFEVLEMDPKDRDFFMARLHEEDSSLADEVDSLLDAHGRSGPLDIMAQESAHQPPRGADDEIGAAFGPYQVRALLGRGGMGVVYRAVRADGEFHQEVALKVLPADLLSRSTHERFLAEREILARLAHPNVARLFHGGVDEKGRPYFAMELVEGKSIVEYCDDKRMSVRDRIGLFVIICEAVQHAHQNLVVHRDLKPGNILVTDDGRPKLLDFGIAKMLSPSAAFATETQVGTRVLTPAYAAPEQLRGAPANTASDIYQLGILLFELLAGVHPFPERRGPAKDPLEWERSSLDPSRPSHAVTATDPDTLAVRADVRATTHDSLRRGLRGDLDAIVLKALRHDPTDRYASALGLAEDLQRYLDHRPVRARRDSLTYRTQRFVRRNRSALAVSAAAVVGLLAFTLGIARESQRTALERDRAEAVSNFMTELFESADPYAVNRSGISVQDVLDEGTERLRADRSITPEVRASLFLAIGEAYSGLAMTEAALDVVNEGLTLLELHGSGTDPNLVRATAQAGSILSQLGRFDEARPLLHRADSLMSVAGISPSTQASVSTSLGGAWLRIGEPERAATYHAAAADFYLGPGEDAANAAGSLADLATVQRDLGNPDSSEVLLRRSLRIREETWGPDHLWVTNTQVTLADLLVAHDRLPEADSLFRQVLAVRATGLGENHPGLVAPWIGLAEVAAARGQTSRADSLFQRAIAAQRAQSGPMHFGVGRTLNTRAIFLQRTGRTHEAETDFRAAVSIFADEYGADHPYTAVVRVNLAWAAAVNGNVDAAGDQYDRALPVLTEQNPDDPGVYGYYTDYGIVLCVRANPEGEQHLRTAAEALARLGPGSDRDLRARNALGSCLMGLGRTSEAVPILESVLVDTESRADDPYRAFAQARLEELRAIDPGSGRDR